jgi:hypothetical protein
MDPRIIEAFSEQVHNAWMVQKQAQGFADHPFMPDRGRCGNVSCTLSADMHHDAMRPYAELSEPMKELDRATVRSVLTSSEAAGYRVVPATSIPEDSEATHTPRGTPRRS